MKRVLILLIELYQKTPLSCHSACRYTPTCSEYMKQAILEYGVIKGLFLGIKRIIRCNPWGNSGFDPVPKKGEKDEKKFKKE